MHDETLFAYLRRAPFGGRMTQSQIDGVKRIHNACVTHGVERLEKIAYVLASVFHETGARMQPVREAFATSDAGAKAALEKAWQAGRLSSVKTSYWRAGWFGRGDIQITHEDNYRKLGEAVGVDLVANPSLALNAAISARIAVIGMRDGLFAKGHTLARYFPLGGPADVLGARKIVNGSDKRQLIAGHYEAILGALKAATMAGAIKPDVPKPAPEPDTARAPDVDVPDVVLPDDVKPLESPALWSLGGLLSSIIGALSNGYALAGFALVLVLLGVGVWAIKTGRISLNRTGVLS